MPINIVYVTTIKVVVGLYDFCSQYSSTHLRSFEVTASFCIALYAVFDYVNTYLAVFQKLYAKRHSKIGISRIYL